MLLAQEEAQEAECSQWMRAKRRRKEPVHVAANGHVGHPGGAQDSAALEAPAVQNEVAALAICQANGALPVATLPKLQHCGTPSEEERLRHENEELRKALDHERQMLKGMVNNQELLKEVQHSQALHLSSCISDSVTVARVARCI